MVQNFCFMDWMKSKWWIIRSLSWFRCINIHRCIWKHPCLNGCNIGVKRICDLLCVRYILPSTITFSISLFDDSDGKTFLIIFQKTLGFPLVLSSCCLKYVFLKYVSFRSHLYDRTSVSNFVLKDFFCA